MRIRELDPDSDIEIDLVATRMRLTLMEVIDPVQGDAMYTLDWLRDRVRFHLDPSRQAAVFVACADDGTIIGHTIVRAQVEEDGEFGLFSTTYVVPEARRGGIAQSLLQRGELWMLLQGMLRAATYTSKSNDKLIRLYESRGYAIDLRSDEMVRLSRSFVQGP